MFESIIENKNMIVPTCECLYYKTFFYSKTFLSWMTWTKCESSHNVIVRSAAQKFDIYLLLYNNQFHYDIDLRITVNIKKPISRLFFYKMFFMSAIL